MKLYKLLPAALVVAAVSLVGCGGDDEPEIEGNVDVTALTPEEIKEDVAEIAQNLLAKFKPEEQKELIDLVNHIAQLYGDLELDPEQRNANAPLRGLSRGYEIIDIISEIPVGIYTPSNGEWVKTGDSNDVVFRIPNDPVYGRVELIGKYSGTQDGTVNVPGEGDYYVKAPTSVEATLTANGKTWISEKLEAKLNVEGKTMTATHKLTAANITINQTINANNTQATVTTSGTVSGEQLINGTATISGRNLCDVEYIIEAADDETLESLISSVTFNGNVMNKLFCQGNVKAVGEVLNAMDSYFDYGSWGDYNTASEASAACDKAVALINRNLTGTFSFTQGGDAIASLTYIKNGYQSSYTDYIGNLIEYGDFYPTPALKFNDGTTYTDDYFEYGFDAVVNQWEALVRAYENICR